MSFTTTAKQSAPEIGVILGSGLGKSIEAWSPGATTPFSEIDGLCPSTVEGHSGTMNLGVIGGNNAIIACGRVHLYEGHSAKDVTATVRFFSELDVKIVVLTNAAGTLHSDQPPGTWMNITDHLNLTGTSPLAGGPNFFDMTNVYDPVLAEKFQAAGNTLSVPVGRGTYAGVMGPQYETPAEIRMLRAMGADAVGMSTVLEAIQARALGLRVLGISRLTNWGAGMSEGELTHEEVIAGQNDASSELGVLLNHSFL